jgi:two-component system response regulator PilR (NtrC family)
MSNIKCRILCIDDHRDSAEMLCVLLALEDYEVVVAESIAEALDLISKETFDLYVLDRRLPDGTGIELCEKLGEACPGVPCIFYTGDAYEVHRLQAIAAGAEGYIAKPHVEALIETVTKLLADKECAAAT